MPTLKGRLFWKLSRKVDQRNLLAIACHEVVHVGNSRHDESFSTMLTALHGAVDQQAGLRRVRAAIAEPLSALTI